MARSNSIRQQYFGEVGIDRMIKNCNHSKKVYLGILVCIFCIMLLLNMLTLYLADDYNYLYNFADGTRIQNIVQIIPSMKAHAESMNGRLMAHFWVQVFGMLPMWCFDVVNAFMFTIMIALITAISECGEKKCNIIPIAIFCAIWLYEPAFGQVNLWQDGACNYLWSIVASLLFLTPYTRMYMEKSSKYEKFDGTIKKAGFLALAFCSGAYSENVSAAMIFIATCLLVAIIFQRKKFIDKFWIMAIVVAILGYISIYLAPAQWVNKSASMSLHVLVDNFLYAVQMYEQFAVLVIAYVILLIINIHEGAAKERIWISVIFLGGSLVSNFIMMFASYYPARSCDGAVMFLIAADAILTNWSLSDARYVVPSVCALAILILAFVPDFLYGVRYIKSNYSAMKYNESHIVECRENGILEVQVEMVQAMTQHSAVYDSKYLDTSDPKSWPNDSIAKFYGVNSVIGVYKQY